MRRGSLKKKKQHVTNTIIIRYQENLHQYDDVSGNTTVECALTSQNEAELFASGEMTNTDVMGKVDGEIIGKSVKENQILSLLLRKGVVIGKVDGEYLDKSAKENDEMSLSSSEDGSKHDCDRMSILEESGCCTDYQMEDFDLTVQLTLTGALLAEVS